MKTLTVTTTGLTGKQWLARMEKGKYQVSSYAKDILLSKEFDAANLKKDISQEIVIVKASDVGQYSTTQQIKDYAKSKGYGMPTPELALLVRETISDEEMKELGVWYVAVLHDPIKDSDGDPDVLDSDRRDGGRWLDAYWGNPGAQWDDDGSFAFLVSASGTQTLDTKTSALEPTLDLEQRVARLEKLFNPELLK